jgi:UDP-N-acetylglucosamine 1-carboxyvinyltransferase
MDKIVVSGNGPLKGQIPIAGAKNACLTLMPATLLSDEPLTLTNAPRLSDIRTMSSLLQSLGAEVSSLNDGRVLALSSHGLDSHTADYDIVRKMRASILVLGPLLAREGRCRRLSARWLRDRRAARRPASQGAGGHGRGAGTARRLCPCRGAPGLKGAVVEFPIVSVGATENALMAATLGQGHNGPEKRRAGARDRRSGTVPAAMGAQIDGAGTGEITIQGVDGCMVPRTRW